MPPMWVKYDKRTVVMNKFVDFACHITKNDYICKKFVQAGRKTKFI